jgi:hypothetical protein
MTVYRDGKRPGRDRSDARSTIDDLIAKLRESPDVGSADRFSAEELALLEEAMGRVAEERLGSVLKDNPLDGKKVDKVFDREEKP